LLQRFDAETCDDEETSNEQPETISFLTQLSTWQKQELDEKLASRVQVSQRAVAKIIQVAIGGPHACYLCGSIEEQYGAVAHLWCF
jgi:CHASE3 domain sensor protein